MSKIDQELYADIRDFLMRPELRLHDLGRRRNLLDDAFRYWNPAALRSINQEGDLKNFVIHLINTLDNYGCFEGTHCLEQLLDSIRLGEGPDIIQHAEKLIQRLKKQSPCQDHVADDQISMDQTIERVDQQLIINSKYQLVYAVTPLESAIGQVYRAIDLDSPTQRVVALKKISDRIPKDTRLLLIGSIEQMINLEHPHIVPVYDWDRENLSYVVMRWIDGATLTDRMTRPMFARKVSEYVSQIADALISAHNVGVLHGNIKPTNILLDEKTEHLYLTDFATVIHRKTYTSLTLPQRQPNDRDYFAPEQLLGKEMVPASDQYSLALLSYHMLTGVYPFKDDQERLRHAENGKPLPSRPTFISDALQAVLNKACAGQPSARFQSVIAFADALCAAVEKNITPTSDRDQEQTYLSLLVRDCSAAINAYVELKGVSKSIIRTKPTDEILTGAGKAAVRVRYPILYQSRAANKLSPEEPTEDVRETLLKLPRVVLLGDPGSGKTTTLLQVALDCGRKAQMDTTMPIPVIVPLNLFDASVTFDDFVRDQMPGIGHRLNEYIRDKRLLLMFDALNEASQHLREEIIHYLRGLEQFVVSCRTKDYREELEDFANISTVTILDFDLPRIRKAIVQTLPEAGEELWELLGGSEVLLRLWSKLVRHKDEDLFWRKDKMPGYTHYEEDAAYYKIHERGLLPLCRNPFMMNLVCGLYESQRELPNNRGELFKRFTKTLIQSEINRIALTEGWPEDDARKAGYEQLVHDALILIASTIQARRLGAGMPKKDADQLLITKFAEKEAQLALILARDSNLIRLSAEQVVFNHQLIQEYFASEIMGQDFDSSPPVPASKFFNKSNWWEPQGWEETAIILAGVRGDSELPRLVCWIAEAQPEVAIRCITDSGIPSVGLDTVHDDLRCWLQEAWLPRFLDQEEPVKARAALGRALGMIGDPRSGVGNIVVKGKEIPEIIWCELPGKNCSISKYPITFAQYQSFIDDFEDGYDNDRWWDAAGREWKRNNSVPTTTRFRVGNHPRCNVSWYEAMAFCQWLSWNTGKEIRLPIEEEWIYAARAGTKNKYSWGDEFDPTFVNAANESEEYALLGPCAVGMYIQSASPFGVEGLIGNVWEWCLDSFEITSGVDELRLVKKSVRILHGGSWNRPPSFAKCNYRYWSYPDYHDEDIGFRVVRVGMKTGVPST